MGMDERDERLSIMQKWLYTVYEMAMDTEWTEEFSLCETETLGQRESRVTLY